MASTTGTKKTRRGAKRAPKRPPWRPRRSYIWAAAFTALIGLWFASGDMVIGGRGDSEARQVPAADAAADAAAEPERPFRVRTRTYTAEARSAELVVRGRTEAEARVEVKAQTAGTVAELPVSKGARVETGDILCRLDAGARAAAVNEARALLAQAEADYEAAEQLAERGHGARLRVAAEQAKLDAAKSALERAELDLAYTEIKAPFDGLVEERPARTGAYLPVGGTCAQLVALDPLTAVGSVSERQIGRLDLGMAGTAALVTGQTAEGTLAYIAPAADAATRTFRIELEIANPDGSLRDGVTADIRVPLESEKAHRLSPAALTLNDAGQIGVRIVEDRGIVRFVPLTLLGEADDGVWAAGLPDSVDVIVVGQEFVVDGQRVEAVAESGAAAR